MKIIDVQAYQILDSRGNPTIETEVVLEDGSRGRGSTPAGHRPANLRLWSCATATYAASGDSAWTGRSAMCANGSGPLLLAWTQATSAAVDQAMITLDGTPSKNQLGANAILSVSMAVAYAAAAAKRLPLYAHLGGEKAHLIPLPEIQVIGGGAHANWNTDIQDFLVVAFGAPTSPSLWK